MGTEQHLKAALRHEEAATNHDRSAAFWDQRGRPAQAGLQRKLADHERHGAKLERQWAKLVDVKELELEPSSPSTARLLTLTNAEQLSAALSRAAESLEQTARLADAHARRRDEAGQTEWAGEERKVAKRARKVAEVARTQAEGWQELAAKLDAWPPDGTPVR